MIISETIEKVSNLTKGQHIKDIDDNECYKIINIKRNGYNGGSIILTLEDTAGGIFNFELDGNDTFEVISKVEFDHNKPREKFYYVYRINKLDRDVYKNYAWYSNNGKFKYTTADVKKLSDDESKKIINVMSNRDEYNKYGRELAK